MTLFNRLAELTVIDTNKDTLRVFRNLRFTFEIEKNSEASSNTAKISVYNLNSESRDAMTEENLSLIFKVGYGGFSTTRVVLKTLFSGNAEKISSKKSGPDFITTFEGQDAGVPLRSAKFNKTYAEGTAIKTIINDAAKALGITYNPDNIRGISDFRYSSSVSFAGLAKDALKELSEKEDLEFSVQDGEVVISNRDETMPVLAVLLNQDTGLISSPIKIEKGIEFMAFINPLVIPGSTVLIQSAPTGYSIIDGNFKVKKCTYTGDTWESDFTMKCESIEGKQLESATIVNPEI